MLEDFHKFILKHQLFNPTDRILIAVSGGIDSMVLSELFHLSSYSFAIAHCNFNLRGKESLKDELFVRGQAEKYKVPYYNKTFKTQEHAEEMGISIQKMIARHKTQGEFDSHSKMIAAVDSHSKNDSS